MAQRLVIAAPHKVAYEEFTVTDPGPGEVRVRTVLSGISHGTEMTSFLGTSPFIECTITPERTFRTKTPDDPPFYPFYYAGYDAVGVVEKVGPGVNTYKPGDRVWFAEPHKTGLTFSQNREDAIKLPDSVPNDEAIMVNLGAISLNAVHDAEIKLGDTVAVFGGGVVGLLAVQFALLNGAGKLFLIEPNAERRAFAVGRSPIETIDPTAENPAAVIQAKNGGQPPDVVIECSGHVRGLRGAIQAAGLAGTVVAAGFYAGRASELYLGEEFLHNRVTVKASMHVWGCPSRCQDRWGRARLLHTVIDLLASHKLRLDGFLSATFPFAEAQQAYEAIEREPGKYLKAALTF